MPNDLVRILSIIRQIEKTPADALKSMDAELLMSVRQMLQQHRRDVDEVIERLSFLEQRPNN